MLSIIIPTLNEEKYLPRLLASIKNQDFSDYEIIVSDGNSKDKTRAVAAANTCRVVVSDRRSPACQRNEGATLARGEILLFLDADSRLPDGFLEKSYKQFIDRGLDAAGFYLRFDSPRRLYKLYNFFYDLTCFFGQFFKPASVGVAIMVKKAYHKRLNGFDESIFIGEDYDYTTRIFKIGRFRMIKKTFIYFSPRRWEKEGQFRVLARLIKASFYFLFKGPIRKKIVKYEFGDFND